jgi:hypothetical protein
MIAEPVNNRKALETDVTLKRKALTTTKASLKAVREKKRKVEMPVFSDIENILLEYGITAAACHGGKLNGVDCHELLTLAKTFLHASKLACSQSHILKGAPMQSSFKHVIYIGTYASLWTH